MAPDVLQVLVGTVAAVSYIARRQSLMLLTVLLGEKPFGAVRKKIIQSPALLCALMARLNDDR